MAIKRLKKLYFICIKEEIMEPTIMYFLLLNCALIVGGFDQDKAVCTKRHLTEVPTDIPPSVKSIDLSKNNFNKIQVANFTHFPNLTSLDLTLNSISLIGKRSFSKLVSLQQLTLSRNNLVHLQDDVFDGLSKLLHLRLDSNKIQAVAPNAFRSLSSLTLLELSRNKLKKIARVNLAHATAQRLDD
uniref:Uncharacterized protein n=1 Tax=Neogobius melanostomus TaxID=47308 RepID=A0A8C6WHD2_9GOBI